MYDPIERARDVAQSVCDGERRKYHRFRAARFYGGVATADCVGCCLCCVFCWSWRGVNEPEAVGSLYGPREVADNLASIAHKKKFRQVRISGNEPTIGREHLLRTIESLPPVFTFILETNGILLGHDRSYAKDLARFPLLRVRVSLKGSTPGEFTRLTGAVPEGFSLQIAALENLVAEGVLAHPAVMTSFSPPENLAALRKRLREITPWFDDFEQEELALYGDVERRLAEAAITPER
jgi:uncharacterized Fe-S cluster-containing radical SAM superfamily protein